MMRFKEYPDMLLKDAIVLACRHMGGVVMSAMIILGGTFATLMPSGLVLLEELATAVIVGLLMLCFVLLPIFLPAAIALPNKLKKIATQKK
jgi:RND superfamily putative drug exporter